jgi:2-polyprenyl-3-methyl-5-hydroxy-6-metoxy-1,4-benzoquinol methylase
MAIDVLSRKLDKSAKILDIGCGTGAFIYYMKSTFPNVVGLDISKKEVDYARSMGLDVVEGNAEIVDTCFCGPFDVVVMSDVLEHMENPNLVLSKVYHLLRKGGIVLLRILNCPFQILKARLLNKIKGDIRWMPHESLIGSGEHLSHFNSNTITKMLTKNGFQNIKIKISPAEFYKNKAIDRLKKIYLPCAFAVHKVCGLVVGNALMVYCEK